MQYTDIFVQRNIIGELITYPIFINSLYRYMTLFLERFLWKFKENSQYNQYLPGIRNKQLMRSKTVLQTANYSFLWNLQIKMCRPWHMDVLFRDRLTFLSEIRFPPSSLRRTFHPFHKLKNISIKY